MNLLANRQLFPCRDSRQLVPGGTAAAFLLRLVSAVFVSEVFGSEVFGSEVFGSEDFGSEDFGSEDLSRRGLSRRTEVGLQWNT
jgi:hypothetical protein